MLTSLKFCAGSVSRKDILLDLKHFLIENGRVSGFNGMLALSSPIPFDIDCKPQADSLIKAVANCEDVITLAMTKAGRLSIKSGAFKASILCVEGESAHVGPEGDRVDFDGAILLKGLQTTLPFVGSDASRAWANGVLIRGESMYATNNVTLVEFWLGSAFPCTVNIPRDAIREMLRIGEPPAYAQVTQNSVTFHYSGERWLRTQLYSDAWPDLRPVFDRPSQQKPLDKRLFEGLEVVKHFTDKFGSIYFHQDGIRTDAVEDEGATFNIPDFGAEGRYNATILALLAQSVTTIDWSAYPGPCLFLGDRLRGAIIGMRK
jgi:hypothetical protein